MQQDSNNQVLKMSMGYQSNQRLKKYNTVEYIWSVVVEKLIMFALLLCSNKTF